MEKWNKLTHVICLVVDGIGSEDFLAQRDLDAAHSVSGIFPSKVEVISPASYGSNMAVEMSLLNVNKTREKILKSMDKLSSTYIKPFHFYRALFPIKKEKKSTPEEDKLVGEDGCLKLRLLLSAQQMIEEGYPLPLPGMMATRYSKFVMTKETYEEANPDSPMFSVDCEMCMTTEGKLELTRICVVNAKLEVGL